MHRKCVINFAKNGWYVRGQERLRQSLQQTGFDGDLLFYTDESELGCPSHSASPYAFKPFALKRAFDLGYEHVIWADASVWAVRNIQPMFDHISKQGWMFFQNVMTGNWTSDACLKGFGITREKAMEIPMLMGICMGWDLTRTDCQAFLKDWLVKAQDGFSFPGSWTNKNREVSDDPLVYGHRHDQSVASILAGHYGMSFIIPHETYFQYYENPKKTIYDGDLSLIRPHNVMTAQGM